MSLKTDNNILAELTGVSKSYGHSHSAVDAVRQVSFNVRRLIGGVCALGIGLAIKIPIEWWTISILESELNKTFEQQHIIEFRPWLLAMVLAFSMIVTTMATILPAWRAARIDPITALRHD